MSKAKMGIRSFKWAPINAFMYTYIHVHVLLDSFEWCVPLLERDYKRYWFRMPLNSMKLESYVISDNIFATKPNQFNFFNEILSDELL